MQHTCINDGESWLVLAKERLRLFSRRVLQEIVEHLPEMTVCFRDLHGVSEGRRGEVLDLHREYERVWSQLLQRGVDDGTFTPSLSGHLGVKALLGLHHYAYIWVRPDGPMSPDEIADVFTDLALNGLLPRSTTEDRSAPEARVAETPGPLTMASRAAEIRSGFRRKMWRGLLGAPEGPGSRPGDHVVGSLDVRLPLPTSAPPLPVTDVDGRRPGSRPRKAGPRTPC